MSDGGFALRHDACCVAWLKTRGPSDSVKPSVGPPPPRPSLKDGVVVEAEAGPTPACTRAMAARRHLPEVARRSSWSPAPQGAALRSHLASLPSRCAKALRRKAPRCACAVRRCSRAASAAFTRRPRRRRQTDPRRPAQGMRPPRRSSSSTRLAKSIAGHAGPTGGQRPTVGPDRPTKHATHRIKQGQARMFHGVTDLENRTMPLVSL